MDIEDSQWLNQMRSRMAFSHAQAAYRNHADAANRSIRYESRCFHDKQAAHHEARVIALADNIIDSGVAPQ